MVADTVVYCYTKKFKKTGQAVFVWYPKEREDLKTIHDENDVLTDDQLVVARSILRSQNIHVYINETNVLVDLGCSIMHEVIILS